jgi:OOP family OmpA-OmpF porin
MSEPPLRIVPGQKTSSDPQPRQAGDLAELRRLLLSPEMTQIRNILERLNNPRTRSKETARILTEAIRLRSEQDESLNEALGPTIVKSFQNSIKRDPQPVADAISPLMGPAIRRYISMMLNNMVQSFDQAMKNSLSAQGVKWRLEAARTGKSFGEVVLLHTLVYRVEQVFLIHRNTGINLLHVTSPTVYAQDPDIISGMMTAMQDAIKSFARDSFGSAKDDTIDTLDLGDREIWFERGPRAVLAVVLHGKAPEQLRAEFFAPAIEAIHMEMGEELESFEGDTRPFELVRHHLEACLRQQIRGHEEQAKPRMPAYFWAVPALLILALGILGFFALREQSRWNAFLEKLRQTPGVVITEEGRRNSKRYVAGLRDPLAEDPDKILRELKTLDPARVEQRWEPYQALDKLFVELRARQLLEPPAGAELRYVDGTLSVQGDAPLRWINEARRLARVLPGISRFDASGLVSREQRTIEQTVVLFATGASQLPGNQEGEVLKTAENFLELFDVAASQGQRAQLEIIGHTDDEGSDSANERLSTERAQRVQTRLIARGINKDLLLIRGAASREPLRTEAGEGNKQFNRSVSFRVRFNPPASSRVVQ